MKLSQPITHTTSAIFTTVFWPFVRGGIALMVPWLIVMFAVVLTDLASGVRKAHKLGIDVSVSTAIRETMGKMVTYFAWVVMVCLLDVAANGNATIAKWACLLVIAIEGGSIVSNIVKPYGVELSLSAILKFVFMRSPLRPTEEEAEALIRERRVDKVREKEQRKWSRKKP